MTTTVTIQVKNAPHGDTVRVDIVDPFTGVPHGYPPILLTEGGEADVLLHQGQSILLKEIQAVRAPITTTESVHQTRKALREDKTQAKEGKPQ